MTICVALASAGSLLAPVPLAKTGPEEGVQGGELPPGHRAGPLVGLAIALPLAAGGRPVVDKLAKLFGAVVPVGTSVHQKAVPGLVDGF